MEHYPNHLRPEDYRARARARAAGSAAGVGAAVQLEVSDERPGKRWEVVISDGSTDRYLEVVAPQLGRWDGVSPGDVEAAVERRAAGLPENSRLFDLAAQGLIELSADELRGE
jgi:hypothetical protein